MNTGYQGQGFNNAHYASAQGNQWATFSQPSSSQSVGYQGISYSGGSQAYPGASAQYPSYQPQPQAGQPIGQYPYPSAAQQSQQSTPQQSRPVGVKQVTFNPVQPVDAAAVAANKPFEPPTKPKKSHLWTAIALFALAVLIGVAAAGCYIIYTYIDGENQYSDLQQYMHINEVNSAEMQPDDSESVVTLGSFDIDWDALRAINSDVVGWVYVPDTVINYPIVWREGDDEYYLKHNFGRNSVGGFGAEYGAIGLSSANSPYWTDRISYLSGHHMANGTMFAAFYHFQFNDVFNSHRTIYVLTPEGNFKLNTFAVNKVLGSSEDTVITKFGTTEEYRAYIQECLNKSLVSPDPPAPSADDIHQAMMFYTCNEPDNRYRICVYAEVVEFLPAGSNVALGNALISEEDVGAVGAAVAERTM